MQPPKRYDDFVGVPREEKGALVPAPAAAAEDGGGGGRFRRFQAEAGGLYDRGKGGDVVQLLGPIVSSLAAGGIFAVSVSNSLFFSQKLNRIETEKTFEDEGIARRNSVRVYQIFNIVTAVFSGLAMLILVLSSVTRFFGDKDSDTKIENTRSYRDCVSDEGRYGSGDGIKLTCALNNTWTRRIETITMFFVMALAIGVGSANLAVLVRHKNRENEGTIENNTSLNVKGLLVANALMLAFSIIVVAYYIYVIITAKKLFREGAAAGFQTISSKARSLRGRVQRFRGGYRSNCAELISRIAERNMAS